MLDEIAAKDFYGEADFIPPALTPGRGRLAALKAIRKDPSRIYQTFPTQQQAFDFCDGQPGYRLRVWAAEHDNNGRRRFIAASYETFWRLYSRGIRFERNLHYYEVIREHHASKLYFDLEFLWKFNPGAHPEQMVDALIAACAKLCGIESISRNDGIVTQLDSTTEKKFSRHLIFESIAFHDNIQAGEFARRAVGVVVENNANLVLVKKSEEEVVPFVDLGVYTKNRCFRLVGSSKFGKTSRLVPLGRPNSRRPSVSKLFFMRSLALTVGSSITLRGAMSPLQNVLLQGSSRRVGIGEGSTFEGERLASSPFPLVDEYVHSIIGKHGGGIYGVTMLSSSETIMYAIKGGYKYCANVMRHHKSNNVILIADLTTAEMYQKCFDPDCRGFRSRPWPLPREICRANSDGSPETYIDESVNDDSLHVLMDRIEGKSPSRIRISSDEAYDGGVDDGSLNALMDDFISNRAPVPEVDGK